MAINLKPVDVAVIGLGAAGGVAVLPLARAGLKIAGIEAGTWMDPHLPPDEIYNNVRRLVDVGAQSPVAKSPLCATAPTAHLPAGRCPSHDERHRRHVHPLLGAELAAESLGFQRRAREAIRRYGAIGDSRRLDARRLASHL